MADGLLGAPGVQSLMASLEVLAARQRTLAQDVANVDTPGYQAVDINFPAAMARALSEQHAGGGGGLVDTASLPTTVAPGMMRVDGNGVDVDKSMVEVAQTSTWYSAVSQDLEQQLAMMRTVVSDRVVG